VPLPVRWHFSSTLKRLLLVPCSVMPNCFGLVWYIIWPMVRCCIVRSPGKMLYCEGFHTFESGILSVSLWSEVLPKQFGQERYPSLWIGIYLYKNFLILPRNGPDIVKLVENGYHIWSLLLIDLELETAETRFELVSKVHVSGLICSLHVCKFGTVNSCAYSVSLQMANT
jgi:hypothetical protein